jgi:hypothetical protein
MMQISVREQKIVLSLEKRETQNTWMEDDDKKYREISQLLARIISAKFSDTENCSFHFSSGFFMPHTPLLLLSLAIY